MVSRGLLILGGLLIVAGLGWALWLRLDAPPPPVISDAGAVVLAMTAPSLPIGTSQAPTPRPVTAMPSSPAAVAPLPSVRGPTPDLLPDWTMVPEAIEPTADPTITVPTPPAPTPARPPAAEGPPTRIVAAAIKLDAKVVPMSWQMVDRKGRMFSEWKVPKNAAGWHVNSGLPGHGENIVLSGHHNIEGKVFRYVVNLKPGDEVTLYAGGRPYVYIVTEKYILKEAGMPLKVRQTNAQWIMPTGDERLTLVTCWPYAWPGNTHRVIVVARPPDYFQTSPDSTQEP